MVGGIVLLKNIVNKFRKKENDIQKLLYELFHRRVYKTAYFITKDPHVSQDILQETFIKAFRNIDSLADIEKAGAWLSSIATRTAIDTLRKQKRWNHSPLEDDLIESQSAFKEMASSVETEIEKNILKQNMWVQINQLSPEYRAVIVLKYIQGLKEQEIADFLNVKVGTVKSRLHRAKSKMRSTIEKSEDPEGEVL